jgi:hypothetical protein
VVRHGAPPEPACRGWVRSDGGIGLVCSWLLVWGRAWYFGSVTGAFGKDLLLLTAVDEPVDRAVGHIFRLNLLR